MIRGNYIYLIPLIAIMMFGNFNRLISYGIELTDRNLFAVVTLYLKGNPLKLLSLIATVKILFLK